MCGTCGCGDAAAGGAEGHDHGAARGRFVFAARAGAHAHSHGHAPPRAGTRVRLERDVLAKNDALAADNRAWLAARGLLAVNLVSAPGSGKTSLLERTVRDAGARLGIVVIEGDQATDRDADRVRAAGARAVQINTGTGCHLDASMVRAALEGLAPRAGSVVMIENVGNLVCPALFDLGEAARVVVMSVTEGDDKPLKYPHMFRSSDVMLLNKIDLAPHVDFDVARCVANARALNPRLRVFEVSARRGDGLGEWYRWLDERRAERAAAGAADTEVAR